MVSGNLSVLTDCFHHFYPIYILRYLSTVNNIWTALHLKTILLLIHFFQVHLYFDILSVNVSWSTFLFTISIHSDLLDKFYMTTRVYRVLMLAPQKSLNILSDTFCTIQNHYNVLCIINPKCLSINHIFVQLFQFYIIMFWRCNNRYKWHSFVHVNVYMLMEVKTP